MFYNDAIVSSEPQVLALFDPSNYPQISVTKVL